MDASVKRDIRLVNAAGIMGSAYVRLAFGQEILLLFITQCLQIPKETWALAAAILPLTSALHLVSAFLTEHLRRRRVLCLTCFAIARLATPAIALLPFITRDTATNARLFYLAAAIIGHAGISALGGSAWSSWVADIVPEEYRGRFWSVRLTFSTLVNTAVLLGAGWLVDYFTPANRWGYLVIFACAFIIGELDLIIHARVPDRPMARDEETVPVLRFLVAPWRHVGFRTLMLYRTLFAFGGGIAGPFAFMYLVEELKLSATQLCLLAAVYMTALALTFGLWRRIGDRVGYRTVALITGTAGGVGILYWWFLRQDNFAVFFTLLVLARVFFGFFDAGMMLAQSTLTMNVAPAKYRSMYFAQVTMICSLALGLGIFCGRWVYLTLNPASDVYFFGTKLTGAHVLVGLFGIFRILSIWLFHRKIPDARAEAARPRINRVLRTNALRIVPTLLPLERPIPVEARAKHIAAVKRTVSDSEATDLEKAIKTVLRDGVADEDEFYGLIGRIRVSRAKGIERMTGQIAESARLHLPPARARAAAKRIRRLYSEGELAACLRAVQRLAHQTTDLWNSPMATSAISVIDALANRLTEGEEPREESVLLAIYAFLQIVREPEDLDEYGRRNTSP